MATPILTRDSAFPRPAAAAARGTAPRRPGIASGGPVRRQIDSQRSQAQRSLQPLDRSAYPEPVQRVLARLERSTPTFVPQRIVQSGSRHVIVAGTQSRVPAVAKCLLHPTAAGLRAVASLREEIESYRALVREAAPVRTPRLLGADPDAGILLMERIPGRVASAYRHPADAPDPREFGAALGAVARLNAWRPATNRFHDRVDYGAAFSELHRCGLVFEGDLSAVQRLLRRLAPGQREFCHGQATLANVILAPSAPVLIGWSSAGWYLPGYDLATLWATLGSSAAARQKISEIATMRGPMSRDGFVLNLVLILAGELRRLAAAERSEDVRLLDRQIQLDMRLARDAVRAAATS